MRPTWLIEAGVYGDEVVPLLDEVRRQGMAAEVVPHQALRKGTTPVVGGRPLAAGACVIGYGTFPFAQQILLHHRWTPGAWCWAASLDCVAYYAHFGRHLLNEHYAILPGVEAIRQRDRLFSLFGREDRVFARPTSAHKLFVGRCIDREAFAAALAPTRYDPATLVVVAAPRPVGREWRLVVVGDRVVAGSQYAATGRRAVEAGCPAEVRGFAEAVLGDVRWRPDPAFMLDVCESAGRLRLIELNSFSGSWLYRCALPEVVSAASELAERSWRAGPSEPPQRPDSVRPIPARRTTGCFANRLRPRGVACAARACRSGAAKRHVQRFKHHPRSPMSDTTFAVSPDVKPNEPRETVDHVAKLRTALRRPIEATWRPRSPLVACDDTHALLAALRIAFYCVPCGECSPSRGE